MYIYIHRYLVAWLFLSLEWTLHCRPLHYHYTDRLCHHSGNKPRHARAVFRVRPCPDSQAQVEAEHTHTQLTHTEPACTRVPIYKALEGSSPISLDDCLWSVFIGFWEEIGEDCLKQKAYCRRTRVVASHWPQVAVCFLNELWENGLSSCYANWDECCFHISPFLSRAFSENISDQCLVIYVLSDFSFIIFFFLSSF